MAKHIILRASKVITASSPSIHMGGMSFGSGLLSFGSLGSGGSSNDEDWEPPREDEINPSTNTAAPALACSDDGGMKFVKTGNTTSLVNIHMGNIVCGGEIYFSNTEVGGLRLNPLSTTQRNALTAANGHLIYNATDSKVQVRAGGAWDNVVSEGTLSQLVEDTVAGISCKVSVYTATGGNTHTKVAGLLWMDVVVVGGGGAGGNGTANSTAVSVGAGGGAGGVALKTLTGASVKATEQLVVGAAMTNSSFGNAQSNFTQIVAGKGANGAVSTVSAGLAGTPGAGGAGGSTSGADVSLVGGNGQSGGVIGGSVWAPSFSGMGGSNMYGQGGATNGEAGKSYGGGGAGGYSDTTDTVSGGAGAQGVVIVKEYYL